MQGNRADRDTTRAVTLSRAGAPGAGTEITLPDAPEILDLAGTQNVSACIDDVRMGNGMEAAAVLEAMYATVAALAALDAEDAALAAAGASAVAGAGLDVLRRA